MKTSNLETNSFLVMMTFFFFLLLGNRVNAQSSTPSCNDCQLTASDLTLFSDILNITYKAEVDVIFGQNHTHFLEFYLNEELIYEAGHENVGFDASKVYSKNINSSELFKFVGKALNVTVKEFKRKDNGTKGEIVYETTKKIYNRTPLIKKAQEGGFAFFTDKLETNSCNGEKITKFNGVPSENSIKNLVAKQKEGDLFLFPKNKSTDFVIFFHAFLSIDKITASIYGNAKGPKEIGVSNIETLNNPFGIYDRAVGLAPIFNELNFNASYNYANAIVLKFYKSDRVAQSLVIPILVVGEDIDLSANKSTWTPPIPSMILHNPIGEGSSAYLAESTSSCSQIRMGLSDESGLNSNLTVTVGAAGSVFGVPFEASASAGAEVSTTNGNSKEMVSDVCIKHDKVIKILNPEDEAPQLEGTAGDRFIGTATQYYYGPSLKIEHSNCGINIVKGIGMKTISAQYFNFTEYEIENTVIPNLVEQITTTNPADAKTLLRLNNSLDAWKTMVQKNRDYVAAQNTGEIESVRSDNPIEVSREVSRTESFSMDTKVVMDSEVFAQAEVNVAGSGFSARDGVSFSNEVTNGNSESTDLSTITGFELLENDAGDIVKVKVIPDKRFGSHIFKLIEEGSQTSCPYIGGKKRDVPYLSVGTEKVQTKVIKNVTVGDGSGDKAVVTLNVCNNSESGENRAYYIKAKDTKNAEIKYSAAPITNRGTLISDIPAGGCKQIDITIDQHNPNSLAYEGITLLLTDACSDVAGEEGIASEVVLDVYFEGAVQLSDYQVQFQVDLSNEIISPNGVFIAGNFQQKAGFPSDWNPTTTPMTDANGDGIYETTVAIKQVEAGQSFRYKFINGTNWESVPAACGIEEGGFINRSFDLVENNIPMTLPVVCFQTCSACLAPEMTLAVTPEEVQVLSAQGGNIEYTVSSNTDWTVSTNASWLIVNAPNNGINDGMVMITCNQNESPDSRAAEIRFTSGNGIYHTRVVSQVGFSLNCTITNAGLQVSECMDNGTPNDTSDDYYEYSLAPEGENLAFNYSVYANNVRLGSEFIYGQREVIAQVPINTTVGTIAIFNEDEIFNCQFNIEVTAPVCTIEPPVTNQADYIVKSMYEPPTEVMAGQEIYMNAEIENIGTAGFSEKTKAYYWLSVDNQLETTVDIYLDEDNIDALAVGSINFDEEYFTIPENIAPGVYYIIYQADALNQVAEKEENNNTAIRQITVIGNQPAATTLACDDFEQYQMTDFCTQSPVWTKWTNNSNGGAISNEKASNGQQSLKIAYDPLRANQTDILARLGDLNTGTYELNWKMYIPQGKTAYFNSQKFQNEPGQEFGFEIIFNANGKAKLKAGGLEGNFDYPQETWMDVYFVFDLDADQVTLKLNEKALFRWDISYTIKDFGKTTQLGAINFYAIDHALFYIDEICLTDISANHVQSATSRSSVNSLSKIGLSTTQSIIKRATTDLVEAQLLQNYPNPVINQTTIPLTIPTEFHIAQLIITCVDGRMMKEIIIKDTGNQQLLVSTSKWSEGIYFYSLMIDNKLISTKRMVVTR